MRKVQVRRLIDQLVSAIGSLFRRRESIEVPPQKSPVADAYTSIIVDDEAVTAWFQANKTCPDCGGSRFADGPQGGMSKNIQCENAACRSQYNVAVIRGHVLFAQRIHWKHPGEQTIH